jgi:hypothetical protein
MNKRTWVLVQLGFSFFEKFLSFLTTTNFHFSSNSSVRRSKHSAPFFYSSIVLNTLAELVLIEERKHGEGNNGHDSKKCENIQNNFRGNLHS